MPVHTELAGIFIKVMDKKTVKVGTCILITSLSYLSRVGVAAYAAEWRMSVNMLISWWAGVSVCPVFPLYGFFISANPEGILTRDTAAKSEGAKENNSLTIILAGASNLASLKPAFAANGAVVIDLTKSGWMIN
jgi:hypothetical protein